MSAEENQATKRKLSENENNGQSETKKLKINKEAESGVLLFSGVSDYEMRNDAKLNNNECVRWTPIRFETLKDVKIKDISTGPLSYFFCAVSDEGKVYSAGCNAKGALGHGDLKSRSNPTIIEALAEYDIVSVATGRQHALFMTSSGEVFACGDNSKGQCGVGNKKEVLEIPTLIKYEGPPIVQVACADEFSLILNEDGNAYSFGSPENGQLANGSENKEIVGRKEIFHYEYEPFLITAFLEIDPDEKNTIDHGQPRIVKIACGAEHGCMIDDRQRIFTWGFGGYGRLGHNGTQNEMFPRLMKCWHRITGRADGGITDVYCGSQFNIVQTVVPKCTYLFGQQVLTKEANMYPKMMDDLMGWNVRHVSCSAQGWIACADDKVITSQPSPCYGGLAEGIKAKSSTAPRIITTLEKVYAIKSGMGYMHSLFLVRDSTEADKLAISKFPIEMFDDNGKKIIPVDKKAAAKKKGASKRGRK